MGKSMRKFKKLAVLAITIPTLLSSYNAFATSKPIESYNTKKMQDIRKKNGLGGFSEFKQLKKNTLVQILKTNKKLNENETIYKNLAEKYGITNANIVVALNYMRSCIHLKSDKLNFLDDGDTKKNMVEFLQKILNGTEINEVKQKCHIENEPDYKSDNTWASFNYVLKLIYEIYINNENKSKEEIKHVFEFIIRPNDDINKLIDKKVDKYINEKSFYKNKINTDVLEYLYTTFSNNGNGQNCSFGKFALENVKDVLIRKDKYSNDFTPDEKCIYKNNMSVFNVVPSCNYTVDNSPFEKEETEDRFTQLKRLLNNLIPQKEKVAYENGNVVTRKTQKYYINIAQNVENILADQ